LAGGAVANQPGQTKNEKPSVGGFLFISGGNSHPKKLKRQNRISYSKHHFAAGLFAQGSKAHPKAFVLVSNAAIVKTGRQNFGRGKMKSPQF
jgi:hypothetical protein